MTPPLEWHDWIAEAFYRIRVAPAALTKISALAEGEQSRLRHMLEDIASIADQLPPSSVGRGWTPEGRERLLRLEMGRLSLYYSIDENARTLSVEHVVVPSAHSVHGSGEAHDSGDTEQTG